MIVKNSIKVLLLNIILMLPLLSGCVSSQNPDESLSISPDAASHPGNRLTFEYPRLAVAQMGVERDSPVYIYIMTNIASPLPVRWEYFTPYDPERGEKTINDIDFSDNFLIFVSMGFQSNTGPKITVENIWQDQGVIYVEADFDITMGKTVQSLYSEPTAIIQVSKGNMTQFGEITFILLDQLGNERATATCNVPR